MEKSDLERAKVLNQALQEAGRKARLNELTNEAEKENVLKELAQTSIEVMESITGKKHFIGEDKDPYSGEPFNQVMHRNLDLLTEIDYLTQAEESFLFRIQAYLEFKTNVIIKKEDKFKVKRRGKKQNQIGDEEKIVLPKAATITDIANMIGKSRMQTSEIMNSLKKKEILLNPEGAGVIIENGRAVTPRTWVVNPYIILSAPRKYEVKLDMMTMRLFQHSLKRLKDKNGKKVNLPVRFF